MPAADIEEKKLALEYERLANETRIREAELAFQREQLNTSPEGFFAWVQTPIGAAVIAGLLGLFGTFFNGYQSNLVEQRKQESTLILEAIKTSGTGEEKKLQTAANLLFLAKAGLIQLSSEKIKELEKLTDGKNSLPSLPAVKSSKVDDIPTPALRDDILDRLANPGEMKPAGTTAPTTPATDENSRYDRLKEALESRKYTFDTTSGHINIVGVRQLDNVDKYDDVIFLIWNDSSGKHVTEFRASCDPGEFYTNNPMNPKGVANLQDGQYDYQFGILYPGIAAKTHKGLRSVAEQTVWRDTNKNFTFDTGDTIDTGNFGLLIQAGGASNDVGIAGAGSQLIYGGKDSDKYKSFLQIIENASPEQKNFSLHTYYSSERTN